MFSLIVSGGLEDDRRGTIMASRVFEYTEDEVREVFKPAGALDIPRLLSIPAVFMKEGTGDEVVRFGWLTRVERRGTDYNLFYTIDPDIARMTNADIYEMMSDLQIDDFEFSRNHWAVKDVDLFQVLYRHRLVKSPSPKIFKLSESPINTKLVSFMMPFTAPFNAVYSDVKAVLKEEGYRCQRADDMWVHDHIITDIIELICTSAVVVCDLSTKNPNVFYEAGIAHTLGKEVILITQSHDDVPFDLRSIRYIHYLNNGEGRSKLAKEVLSRVERLV